MFNREGEGVEWSPMDCEVLSLRCLIMFLPPQLIRLCYNCSCFPFWSGQLALAGLNRIYKSPSDISHHLFSKSLLSRYNLLFSRSLFYHLYPDGLGPTWRWITFLVDFCVLETADRCNIILISNTDRRILTCINTPFIPG